jgi:hypothetical protein
MISKRNTVHEAKPVWIAPYTRNQKLKQTAEKIRTKSKSPHSDFVFEKRTVLLEARVV